MWGFAFNLALLLLGVCSLTLRADTPNEDLVQRIVGPKAGPKTAAPKTKKLATPTVNEQKAAKAKRSLEQARKDLLANATFARPPTRPIPWQTPPWVDVGDYYTRKSVFEGEGDGDGKDHDHDHNGMNGGGSGKNSGKNGTGGKGKGGGGAGDGNKAVGFGYDDNAPKTPATNPPPPVPPKEGGGGPVPPTQPPQLQIFGKYWPMCMFFPPEMQAKANQIVKRVVEMAAKCEVNVLMEARPIKSLADPENTDQINALSIASCNAKAGLGVPSASVLVASPSLIAADKMCRQRADPVGANCPAGFPQKRGNDCYKTATSGCAVLCKNGSDLTDQGVQNHGHSHSRGDGIIPSIIDLDGQTGETAAHEAFGHSQMCWDNGTRAGNGIGPPAETRGEIGGMPPSPNWTDMGCQQMRDNAYANTRQIGFNPNQPVYFTAGDPERWLTLGQPLWPPPGEIRPPPQPPAPPGITGAPPAAPPSQLSNNFNPPVGGGGPPPEAGPPGGHKKQAGGGGAGPGAGGTGVTSLRNGTAGKNSVNPLAGIKDLPKPDGKPDGGKSFGYDESNIKQAGAIPGAGDVSGGASGAGGGNGFGYDENETKLGGVGGDASKSASEGGPEDVGKNPGKEDGKAVAEGDKDRRPSSIPLDVKAGSSILDDAFFKKVKYVDEEQRKRRGESLRRSGPSKKPIYQSE